jgi:hypothetical protein
MTEGNRRRNALYFDHVIADLSVDELLEAIDQALEHDVSPIVWPLIAELNRRDDAALD